MPLLGLTRFRSRPRNRVHLLRDRLEQRHLVLALGIEVEMGAAGDEAEGRFRAEPVEHRLQPVRGAIEVEGIGGADDQVDLAVEVGLEARPVALDDMSNIVVLAPVSRSEEHTSELQSLMRISYAVFCLKKKK